LLVMEHRRRGAPLMVPVLDPIWIRNSPVEDRHGPRVGLKGRHGPSALCQCCGSVSPRRC
jgi:hypothetical protein